MDIDVTSILEHYGPLTKEELMAHLWDRVKRMIERGTIRITLDWKMDIRRGE